MQYRVSGPDVQKVRELAQKLAALVGEHPRVSDIGFNWNEPARVVKVDVLQDKARQLGVTSQDIAGALNSVVGGTSITQVRDAIYLVDVVEPGARRRAAVRSRRCRTCSCRARTASPCRSRRSRPSTTSSSSR